jgi:hypothetical protein
LLIALLWIAAFLKTGTFEWMPVALGVGGVVAWALWLSRFELVLGANSFDYRSLTYLIEGAAYADLKGIVANASGEGAGGPAGMRLSLRDGRKLPINFRVFAKEASEQFLERATHGV